MKSRIKTPGKILVTLFAALMIHLLWLSGPSFAAGGKTFEAPPTLSAAKILSKTELSGANHTVDDAVKNDGFLNRYSIRSTFGNFDVLSTFLLQKRIHEIKVIAEMEKIKTSDTVVNSLGESGKKTVAGIKNLVTDPGNTLSGAGEGISSLFGRAKESFHSDPSQAEDSRAEQIIGVSGAKRKIAQKFGVDVYSANDALQKQLDRLAWADYAGGIGVSAGLSVIPGGAGLLLTASGAARLLNDQISATPPTELRSDNRRKLTAMGFNEDTIELFLNNTVFSPRDQTWLVASLEKLKGAVNRELFLKVALQVNDRTTALLVAQMSIMCAGYHEHISQIDAFYPVGRVLYAQDNKGVILLILPTDYITWNDRLAGAVAQIQDKMKGKKAFALWTVGDVSKSAKDNLASAGWTVHTQVLPKITDKK